MSLDIVVTGLSIVKGNPKIDPGLFPDEVATIDKGPYELNRIQKVSAITFMKALLDAGISLNESNRSRIGIFLGNSYSIEEFKAAFLKIYKAVKPGLVNPSMFTFTTANSIASWLGVQFGIRGINLTFTSGGVSGSHAVFAGCDCLTLGKVDIAIVGGVSLICEDFKDEFYASGFQQEFAGFLILERKENAIDSGRKIHFIIEDFKQGFLSKACIEELNNTKLPIEIKDYCQHSEAKCVLTHLGNNLIKHKVSCRNKAQRQDESIEIIFLNEQLGNVFSASGIVGLSCVNKNNCVFIDVDSCGSYAALKINAE